MSNTTSLATIDDLTKLWRPLQHSEVARAEELLKVVSDMLREEAFKVGKDLDKMIAQRPTFKSLVKSVLIDIVARVLMTSTNQEPMTQYAQAALGYSVSGSYLVPGGGVFIKKSELERLGLKRQRYGGIEFYDINSWNDNNSD